MLIIHFTNKQTHDSIEISNISIHKINHYPSRQYRLLKYFKQIMKLRFKIVSCSSQQPSYPASNLLTDNNLWQSARFSQYPQQLTIMFYQPVKVHKIIIASHQTKISTRINVLYYLPSSESTADNFIFTKLGFISFSSNEATSFKGRQAKHIKNLNIQCLYVRFILHKNYPNKENFFNQVGLSKLQFQGSGYDYVLPMMRVSQINADKTQFIESKLMILNQFKEQFVKDELFQQAKKVKEYIQTVKKIGAVLKNIEDSKLQAVRKQQYDQATKFKKKANEIKQKIVHMIDNFYDPVHKVIKPVKSQTHFKRILQEQALLSNNSYAPGTITNGASRITANSRITKKRKNSLPKQQESVIDNFEINDQGEDQQNEIQDKEKIVASRISYDDRIIPALLHKKKPAYSRIIEQTGADNQFLDVPENVENIGNTVVPQAPQEISAINMANSTVVLEFYSQQFVKKIHSKFWQFKLQALQQMQEEIKKKKPTQIVEKNRMKAYIFVFNKVIKEGNYPVVAAAINLLSSTLSFKIDHIQEFKQQYHYELQHTINQIIIKMTDTNHKIQQQAKKLCQNIPSSPAFGVHFTYTTITKQNPQKLSVKIKLQKLQSLRYLVERYGVTDHNKKADGVPLEVTDYAIKMAEDPNNQVRKAATILLKYIRDRGGKQRISIVADEHSNLKTSIQKQLRK